MTGKSYPLLLEVRTPTPEDLIKANERGTVPMKEEDYVFNSVSQEDSERLDKR
jgi:hypothetical protein